MGIGVVAIQTTQKKDPAGSPFTSSSAHEGTSIDAAGKVVLGQTVGAAGNPALLDRNAEIPVDASARTVTFHDLANTLQTVLGVGVVTLVDSSTNLPRIALQTSVAANNATLANNAGSVEIRDNGNTPRFTLATATGNETITGTITTGAAGGFGAGAWNLGTRQVSSGLTLDDTNYIGVRINNVLYRIALVLLPG